MTLFRILAAIHIWLLCNTSIIYQTNTIIRMVGSYWKEKKKIRALDASLNCIDTHHFHDFIFLRNKWSPNDLVVIQQKRKKSQCTLQVLMWVIFAIYIFILIGWYISIDLVILLEHF